MRLAETTRRTLARAIGKVITTGQRVLVDPDIQGSLAKKGEMTL